LEGGEEFGSEIVDSDLPGRKFTWSSDLPSVSLGTRLTRLARLSGLGSWGCRGELKPLRKELIATGIAAMTSSDEGTSFYKNGEGVFEGATGES
jgi:hypothetical protein